VGSNSPGNLGVGPTGFFLISSQMILQSRSQQASTQSFPRRGCSRVLSLCVRSPCSSNISANRLADYRKTCLLLLKIYQVKIYN